MKHKYIKQTQNLLFSGFILALLFHLDFLISPIKAQNNNEQILQHNEVQDDAYLPLINPKKSPAYSSSSSVFFTSQVNVDVYGDNIIGDAANEPSIAVDPNNPDFIVIGWRQFDNVSSNFRQAGLAYTDDGGETWYNQPPLEAGIFRSDPVLGSNTDGDFFYNSLTLDNAGNFFCTVFRSHDSGETWDGGVFAQGGDKQWITIDHSGGLGNNNIYSSWSASYSWCYPNFFTRSTDLGNSYETCLSIPGNPYWGTMAIGYEGELFVAGNNGSGGIVVARSDNARDPDAFVIWDMMSTSIDLDGSITGFTEINPEGLLGQVWIDVDRSNGVGSGNVYVAASVKRDMIGDPGDVMFAKSTDGGQNWGSPIRINTDISTDNYQWFGTMSVAPDGRIDIIWLDTRDAVGYPYLSSLYYSYSTDQGVTWSENEKLSELFNPHIGYPNQNKMGDYFDMVSDLDGVHIAWANTLNNEEDVYYGHINPWYVGVEEQITKPNSFLMFNYPNPFKDATSIRYELMDNEKVNISVYDVYGKLVDEIKNGEESSGIHNIVFDSSDLTPGIYYCKLTAGGKSGFIKMIINK